MRTKFPIKWHLDCLNNSRQHYSKLRMQALSTLERCNDADEENAFYSLQIEEALRRGVDSFDRERFMVKRTPKSKEAR